jgi:hypothetical protein
MCHDSAEIHTRSHKQFMLLLLLTIFFVSESQTVEWKQSSSSSGGEKNLFIDFSMLKYIYFYMYIYVLSLYHVFMLRISKVQKQIHAMS